MSEVMTVGWTLALGIGLTLILLSGALFVDAERARGRRMQRLARATGQGGAMLPAQAEDEDTPTQRAWARGLRMAGERMAVILGGEARETAAELATAGFRGRDALLVYAFAKSVLPVLTLGIGALYVHGSVEFGLPMLLPVAGVIGAALALSKGVDGYVGHVRKTRLARIRRGFPDLLELLVITSEAGLGPQPALHRVAREMRTTHRELAEEVLQMVSEMAMTNDRRQAYARLTARVPLPEVGVFTQALDQSDTYGTPFSRAMRTLISETRNSRLIRVEEQAARLPVLMTLPLIMCIMPAVFIVLVGPAGLSVLDNIMSGG
ncbi:type II secretion system F family protein [Sagittula sp. SSi028]|uniref:type II secretion system F family protein n=1 Tax=Sagittula sp. SSi028 TaxID=3400636 RepID=UPI003AF8DCED